MNLRRILPLSLGGCPAAWELTRASLEESDHRDVAAHARTCALCAPEWEALARTSAFARQLPAPLMSPGERLVLEERILGEAAVISVARARRPRSTRSWRPAALLLLSSGLAIAAVVVVGELHLREVRRQTTSVASLRAIGATTFWRLRPPPDELVRLDAGTLEVTVAPSEDGRHVRIETADASIDAPAGRFRVEARAHILVAVRVFAGYAEVTTKGERAALHAGDEWARAPSQGSGDAATAVAPAPAEEPVPPTRSAAPPRGATPRLAPAIVARASRSRGAASASRVPGPPPHRPESTPATSFERGWSLLRAGDPLDAAAVFAEVDALANGEPLAEDAAFWRSVALQRGGRKVEARAAFADFLRRFPTSARCGEASAFLGWLLLDAGDRDGARRAFERALQDRVDRVRTSASRGLEQLEAAPGSSPAR